MKKAASGSGSIRQRPDGLWEARYSNGFDPGTGKPIRKSIYGKTQGEVRKKLTKVLAEIDSGTYVEESKQTVKEWIMTWFDEYCINVKETTRIKYRGDIENHILPGLGAVKLCNLTPVMIQRFYNCLAKECSTKSVKNVHGVLHQALKQARKLGYIRSNPSDADMVTLPRIEKPEIQPLSAPELKKLLDALGDDVYAAVIRVAVFTGMREAELLGLQWECVNFDAGTILVKQQLIYPRQKGDTYRFGTLKNDKPRVIQPPPSIMTFLKQHKRKQAEQRILCGNLWQGKETVFTNEFGGYLNQCSVWRHFKQYLEAAGLPDHRFHDLRHTYATMALQTGIDVKTVQDALGHHSAAFTLDVYGHVTDGMREAAAQRMERLIENL